MHRPTDFAPSLHALIAAYWITPQAAHDCVQVLQEETAGVIVIGLGSSGRMTLTQALVKAAFPQNARAFVLSIGSETISTHWPHTDVCLHAVPNAYAQRIVDGQYAFAVFSKLHASPEWALWHRPRLFRHRSCQSL